MTGPALLVRSSSAGGLVTLRVSGDLDVATAPYLQARLRSVCRDGARVDVDLSGVTFLDCAGLRPLSEARADIGTRLALVAPSVPVARFLQLLRPRG